MYHVSAPAPSCGIKLYCDLCFSGYLAIASWPAMGLLLGKLHQNNNNPGPQKAACLLLSSRCHVALTAA